MTEVMQHKTASSAGIQLTEAAKNHILSYVTKQGHKGVRLSVKKTGCSGLSYVIDYVDQPLPEDIVESTSSQFIVCIDKGSYPYLKGIQMDYIKQGLNYKFVFINPNQTGQCGCGESFTVG